MGPKAWGTATSAKYNNNGGSSNKGGGAGNNNNSSNAAPNSPTPSSAKTLQQQQVAFAASSVQAERERLQQQQQRPPAAAAAAKGSPAASGAPLTEGQVRVIVRNKIEGNNLLGLPAGELANMVGLLLTCNTRAEVFNWCDTLMLSEADGLEIIRLREQNNVGRFEDGGSGGAAGNGGNGGAGKAPSPPLPSSASSSQKKGAPQQSPASSAVSPAAGVAASPSAGSAAFPTLGSIAASPATASPSSTSSKVLTLGSASTQQSQQQSSTTKSNNSSSKNKKRGVDQSTTAFLKEKTSLVVGSYFECGCFAAQHAFISNCLNCGRIFCEQEMPAKVATSGSYAAAAGSATAEALRCYFCGMDPNMNVAFELKVQQGIVDELAAQANREGYEKAAARRDQLMQFAIERVKRTTVVDEQAGFGGVGRGGVGVGASTVWLSQEEREADEVHERKQRIADMHRDRGVYKLHLDIVNQSVCLGAIPQSQQQQEQEQQEKQEQEREEKKKLAAAAARTAMLPSLPGTTDANISTANATALKTSDDNDDDDNDNDDDDNDKDDDDDADPEEEEEDGTNRVAPLPTLLQRIWYEPKAAAAVGGDSGHEALREGDAEVGAGAKPSTHRGDTYSRRVQNDYFADDDITFRIAVDNRALFRQRNAQDSADPLQRPPQQLAAPSTLVVDPAAFSAEAALGPEAAAKARQQASIAFAQAQSDGGLCLSLHQPWASLVASGIMIHEGRSWPHEHRGRLWIHAAAAQPTVDEIEQVERHFSNHKRPDQPFPRSYPTKCLLGCVNVDDCLPRDEYLRRFPPKDQQSMGQSEFLYLCSNARMLPFPLPMDGKHKIYKLERKIHGAARQQLGEQP